MTDATSNSSDASYMELMWPLVLSGDAVGQLNWATGVLSLDIDHHVWSDLEHAPPAEAARAITAYHHELVHVLQIGLFGFPYEWATKLFDLLRTAVSRLGVHPGNDDFGPILKAIDLGERALTDEEAGAVRAHFDQLDQPTEIGLTTRAILESHAHFVERRADYRLETVAEMLPHLADAPGPEYRAAFDVLAYAIGEVEAFDWFPLVSATAMCTSQPAVAFGRIAMDLAAYPEMRDNPPTRHTAQQTQRDVADLVDDILIGSAQQQAVKHGDTGSFHLRVVRALNKAFSDGTFDPLGVCVAPHEELGPAEACIEVPMFLRPAEPQGFALQRPRDMEEAELLMRATTAAVTAQVGRSIETASRAAGDEALDGLAWLRNDRAPIQVQLDLEQVNTLDPSILNLVDSERHTTMTGRDLAGLWSRAVLMAPLELDNDGALSTIEPVRAYLAALRRLFPAFPAVLSWRPGVSGFVDWFGSVAPEAMHDGQLDLRHEAVLAAVTEAATAITELGEQVGQNPRLLIMSMAMPVVIAAL